MPSQNEIFELYSDPKYKDEVEHMCKLMNKMKTKENALHPDYSALVVKGRK